MKVFGIIFILAGVTAANARRFPQAGMPDIRNSPGPGNTPYHNPTPDSSEEEIDYVALAREVIADHLATDSDSSIRSRSPLRRSRSRSTSGSRKGSSSGYQPSDEETDDFDAYDIGPEEVRAHRRRAPSSISSSSTDESDVGRPMEDRKCKGRCKRERKCKNHPCRKKDAKRDRKQKGKGKKGQGNREN